MRASALSFPSLDELALAEKNQGFSTFVEVERAGGGGEKSGGNGGIALKSSTSSFHFWRSVGVICCQCVAFFKNCCCSPGLMQASFSNDWRHMVRCEAGKLWYFR